MEVTKQTKAPWLAPQLVVVGHVREIVLASVVKGSPVADGVGPMADNFKNMTSTN